MVETLLPRDSVEYVEILSDVFAAIVRRTASGADNHTNGEITPSLVQCLDCVYLHGPSSIRKIAAGLSVSVPAASQLVDRLVQKDLVTREHNQDDRRLARVELTDEGREVAARERTIRIGWLQRILDRMPVERRQALVDSLEDFIRVALESEGQVDRACVRCGIEHLAFCVVSKARAATTGLPMEEF